MACIVVAFSKHEDAVSIRNILVRNGYNVSAVCTSGTKVLASIEEYSDGIVICGYKINDMVYYQLRENLPESFQMLLLASPSRTDGEHCDGVVNVSMPLKVYDLIETVEMLWSAIARRRRKRRSVPRERSQEEKKLINDAKVLLMNRNGMSEDEAHRYIQKVSMDSGTNMVEAAQMILLM